jgi:hypothetical protein
MKRLHSIPTDPRPAANQAGRPARLGTAGLGSAAIILPLILALTVGAALGPVSARAQDSSAGPSSSPSSESESGAALVLEIARLRAEIDALRAEERRRDRRSEILGREAEAEQRYRGSDRDYLERSRPDPDLRRLDAEEDIQASRIERKVAQLEQDAEAQRDLAAARLGISREEYEKAMRDRFIDRYYGGGSWR